MDPHGLKYLEEKRFDIMILEKKQLKI